MRAVPFSYIARNLWVRRVTTLLTAGGMALVVGAVAAAWPAWRMSRIDIVAGLRHVG